MPTERIDPEIGRPLEAIQYGGFWPRCASLLLDGLILSPISLLGFWMPTPYSFALFYLFIGFFLTLFYEVYLVRRWGATPGKLIMGLRIRKVNGEPVGYREALLRAAPGLIFDLFGSIAFLAASFEMTASHYGAIPILERFGDLAKLAPSWYRPVEIASNVWSWGELIVLLTNRKRRALHDFIAGTVVVVLHRRQVTPQSRIAIPG